MTPRGIMPIRREPALTPHRPAGAAMSYATIVADPPWAYAEGWPAVSTSPNAQANPRGVDPKTRRALPYGSMTVEAIKALRVADLAADDAHLLLWTTNRYLRPAYEVAEAWGFRPSQLLTWCKPPMGLGPGGVFSNTSEFVVYARRGKPQHTQRQDSTWWAWPRGPHSAKPEAFLDMVEQALPGRRPIARNSRGGGMSECPDCSGEKDTAIRGRTMEP